VNMPATQLQVAMGIPLNRIPDIRRFYDKEIDGDSAIDFIEVRDRCCPTVKTGEKRSSRHNTDLSKFLRVRSKLFFFPIFFLPLPQEDYRAIDTHVIAARITAENPDEGFKPTSGTIERVKFQSTTNVWGYFSVGANGGELMRKKCQVREMIE